MEQHGARVCGIPRRLSEVVTDALDCLLGAIKIGKEASVHFLSLLSFSSLKESMEFCGDYTTRYREKDQGLRESNSRREQATTPTSSCGSYNLKF